MDKAKKEAAAKESMVRPRGLNMGWNEPKPEPLPYIPPTSNSYWLSATSVTNLAAPTGTASFFADQLGSLK